MVKKKIKTEKTVNWPNIVKGTHLTITTFENGDQEMDWNFPVLIEEIETAISKLPTTSVAVTPSVVKPKKVKSKK
jgi:hypothetical protein